MPSNPEIPANRVERTLCLGLCLFASALGCSVDHEQASRAPEAAQAPASVAAPPPSIAPSASRTSNAPVPAPPSDPAHAFDPPAELRLPSTRAPGERVPLLLVLHGFGVSSSLLIAKAALNQVADDKKFAYLAPEGTRDSAGRPYWNAGPSCCDLEHRAPNDVKRLSDLLDFALKNPAIDPARVFIIGYSNGGFMAERLACSLSDRIAGIISVAGAAAAPDVPCTPSTPLSVLEIHGDADPIVHYEGGVVFDRTDLPPHPGARETAQIWAKRLGCSPAPENAGKLDLEPYIAGEETERQRYTGCRGAVELWTVHGGGHYVALQPPAIDAMWAFITAHPKAGA
ncbi:MAG TPA: PHB depolymerase family esterase [Polyangiaceae bacterium]|jgi:polyhydroxybutyrate depolymerase|nr:PHB depolymerase family esterase [Polyangiaceae bacterium]